MVLTDESEILEGEIRSIDGFIVAEGAGLVLFKSKAPPRLIAVDPGDGELQPGGRYEFAAKDGLTIPFAVPYEPHQFYNSRCIAVIHPISLNDDPS